MALKDLLDSRKQNLQKLLDAGINPYPYKFEAGNKASEIHEKFDSLKEAEETKEKVSVFGRVMSCRVMGKMAFLDLMDETGRIQLVFRQDLIEKKFDLLKAVDIGDFLGIQGTVFKTKRGELSVLINDFEFMGKALRPLPEKWHGLKDIETKYRHRSLDLIMNPETRKVFELRSKIIDAVREYWKEKGFLEVETPLIQPVYGGANAHPFITKSNALEQNLYLSISPELYLKRLIVGGYEKVFTICKNFRNEDIDKTHNPEFTMLEAYQVNADYNDMMKLTEELFEFVAKKVLGKTKIEYEGKQIELKAPWKKITMKNAVKEFAGIDADKASEKEMLKKIEEKEKYDGPKTKGWLINELFERFAEEKLIQPTHIMNHPKETTPLCKKHRKEEGLIERFEPFINGWEMANGYSELNDAEVQRESFEEQEKTTALKEKHPKDLDFIEALEYGMPPAGGVGIGIDRMVMLLLNQTTIRDVIFFPQMKTLKEKK
ncbi:MAG: lysine--tRNA ligase [Candidatus Diapherotrites archaeon]|nr:lysine--tRNA ligase [Candidatus Diapherotrites archaeon]